ncbi:YjcZ family sporulation protein [Bacillus carboniphilus]|uniref:YjcZ family sporulation protein n=1 Tax=Bacillus carboniphilus TaxID=86663 RepID=A0ABY9JXW8_9BACI|nr:YjcZ family sporulation protein [Bacillus carboniphilus]WLR43363.1 YjcZ family sporulation protein [Bacillus carboniphilus]
MGYNRYGYGSCGPTYGGCGYGGYALILVLFILLVIIGAAILNG